MAALLTACGPPRTPHTPASGAIDRAALAEQVRAEYLRTWNDYRTYAEGHDDLRPLSRSYKDWYDEPLLMTAVDALDGLMLLGYTEEADATREYLAQNLSFDRDISVKTFEIVIRLLGGLLSSYQLSGDDRLLLQAEDLGRRLLPAFDSPTGLPYTFVNLRTGEVREPVTNPAEIGTLILEFGTLGKLTGDPVYYTTAKRAIEVVFDRRSEIDLVGSAIHVETGEWVDTTSHLSGRIDSYYEYLLKGWLLFEDEDLKAMWDVHLPAIQKHLARREPTGLWYGWVDMHTGEEIAPHFGALDAFFPAVLALAGETDTAAALQTSAAKMWNLHGIEPELIDFREMRVLEGAYPLRPEIVESAYYLHHFTEDPQYLEMGAGFFRDLLEHCKADVGFAALADVRTMERRDEMQSFLLAETLKYFYLLFADPRPVDLDTVVFNTEAHPLRRTW